MESKLLNKIKEIKNIIKGQKIIQECVEKYDWVTSKGSYMAPTSVLPPPPPPQIESISESREGKTIKYSDGTEEYWTNKTDDGIGTGIYKKEIIQNNQKNIEKEPEKSVNHHSNMINEFQTLDSGKREVFNGGAQRDIQDGKPRFDLIPPLALKRVADLYSRGAKKYDEWNWSKSMPYSRLYSSGFRHLMQFAMGDKTEDHLSAVVFNILAIIHFQEMGRKDLDDMPKWEKQK